MCQQLIQEWNGDYSSILYLRCISRNICSLCLSLHCRGIDGSPCKGDRIVKPFSVLNFDIAAYLKQNMPFNSDHFCICIADVLQMALQ